MSPLLIAIVAVAPQLAAAIVVLGVRGRTTESRVRPGRAGVPLTAEEFLAVALGPGRH